MPKYDKRCADCNELFVVEVSYSDYDSKKIKCPTCGSKRLVSIIKPNSIIFRGKGFTKTAKDTSGEERPFDE